MERDVTGKAVDKLNNELLLTITNPWLNADFLFIAVQCLIKFDDSLNTDLYTS